MITAARRRKCRCSAADDHVRSVILAFSGAAAGRRAHADIIAVVGRAAISVDYRNGRMIITTTAIALFGDIVISRQQCRKLHSKRRHQ